MADILTLEVPVLASIAIAGVALAGVTQAAAGLLALRHFRHQVPMVARHSPPVTIMKPLHGDEPMLDEALASCCQQDYPEFQLIFGLQSPEDPALAVVERLRRRFPQVPIDVVVDRTQHGTNHKISNLINMMPYVRHDVIVIADSDMHVAPDYLHRVIATLEQPGVGLVTTLYAGWPASDALPGLLGAAQINHAFLPGALLARALGRQDCLGATMAITRDTLDRVGGLHAVANELADDAVLGRLVRQLNLSVVLAPTIPATTVPETQLPSLIQHELRWARTIKSLAPLEFAASSIQYPLAWAALCVAVGGGAGWTWALFAGIWVARALLAHGTDRNLKIASALPIWFLPLRDILSVSVILASYRSRKVAWRGAVLRAARPRLEPGKG